LLSHPAPRGRPGSRGRRARHAGDRPDVPTLLLPGRPDRRESRDSLPLGVRPGPPPELFPLGPHPPPRTPVPPPPARPARAAGALPEPAVLAPQARRMLRDDRVRGLATEFAGNWLDFRRFEEHNSVDRGRFPTFDEELRRSMFEEPIRFFVDLVREDRPALEF